MRSQCVRRYAAWGVHRRRCEDPRRCARPSRPAVHAGSARSRPAVLAPVPVVVLARPRVAAARTKELELEEPFAYELAFWYVVQSVRGCFADDLLQRRLAFHHLEPTIESKGD